MCRVRLWIEGNLVLMFFTSGPIRISNELLCCVRGRKSLSSCKSDDEIGDQSELEELSADVNLEKEEIVF